MTGKRSHKKLRAPLEGLRWEDERAAVRRGLFTSATRKLFPATYARVRKACGTGAGVDPAYHAALITNTVESRRK